MARHRRQHIAGDVGILREDLEEGRSGDLHQARALGHAGVHRVVALGENGRLGERLAPREHMDHALATIGCGAVELDPAIADHEERSRSIALLEQQLATRSRDHAGPRDQAIDGGPGQPGEQGQAIE